MRGIVTMSRSPSHIDFSSPTFLIVQTHFAFLDSQEGMYKYINKRKRKKAWINKRKC
jgi:hypothetical protein